MVRAATQIEDLLAEELFLPRLHEGRGLRLLGRIVRVVILDLFLDRTETRVAGELVLLARIQGVFGALAPRGFDLVPNGLIDFRRFKGALRLPGLVPELLDGGDDLLAAVVAVLNRLEHRALGGLAGIGFDHDDPVRRRRDRDVDIRIRDFFVIGIEHPVVFADACDAHGSRRQDDGDIGNRDRRGGADHGVDAGVVAWVCREDGGDDLCLVAKAGRKQRPQRSVDHPAGDRLLLGRSALPLDVASGESPRSKGVLAIIDGQREKVDTLARLRRGRGSNENLRVAATDDHGAARLLGQAPRFERDRLTVQLEFNNVFHDGD